MRVEDLAGELAGELREVGRAVVPVGDGGDLSGIVDPDNLIEELDEGNNLFFGPVQAEGKTWGAIKAIYR